MNHLINLALPALAVALALPVLARLPRWSRIERPTFRAQVLVNLVAAVAVVVAGLWYWGSDGKMVTYLGMAVACASTQWLMVRGWRP